MPAAARWSLSLLASMGNWASDLLVALRRGKPGAPPPVCRLNGPPVVVRGTALPVDEKTYVVLPFVVPPGATRIDIAYDWRALPPSLPENPITQTVLDLGLSDEHGYRAADGFRGWSGSRHRSIFVEGDQAQRAYRPGPVNPRSGTPNSDWRRWVPPERSGP